MKYVCLFIFFVLICIQKASGECSRNESQILESCYYEFFDSINSVKVDGTYNYSTYSNYILHHYNNQSGYEELLIHFQKIKKCLGISFNKRCFTEKAFKRIFDTYFYTEVLKDYYTLDFLSGEKANNVSMKIFDCIYDFWNNQPCYCFQEEYPKTCKDVKKAFECGSKCYQDYCGEGAAFIMTNLWSINYCFKFPQCKLYPVENYDSIEKNKGENINENVDDLEVTFQ